MKKLTTAERIIMDQIRSIERNILDLKRQKEKLAAGLYELRDGDPILQGPCLVYNPITKKREEVKAL